MSVAGIDPLEWAKDFCAWSKAEDGDTPGPCANNYARDKAGAVGAPEDEHTERGIGLLLGLGLTLAVLGCGLTYTPKRRR